MSHSGIVLGGSLELQAMLNPGNDEQPCSAEDAAALRTSRQPHQELTTFLGE